MGNYLCGFGKDVCEHCHLSRTAEGHDGCVGTLEGVRNACCGHGETDAAYVQFSHSEYSNDPNRDRLCGQSAIRYIKAHSLGCRSKAMIGKTDVAGNSGAIFRYQSSWQTEYRCTDCKEEVSDYTKMYSGGRCPNCGYKGHYAITIMDVIEHAYRLVRHGKWWQFWIRPVRQYK